MFLERARCSGKNVLSRLGDISRCRDAVNGPCRGRYRKDERMDYTNIYRKIFRHHRRMGTADDDIIRADFKSRAMGLSVGVHPLWQLFRSAYQMTPPPGFFRRVPSTCWLFLGDDQARSFKAVSAEFVHSAQERKDELKEYLPRMMRRSAHDSESERAY